MRCRHCATKESALALQAADSGHSHLSGLQTFSIDILASKSARSLTAAADQIAIESSGYYRQILNDHKPSLVTIKVTIRAVAQLG